MMSKILMYVQHDINTKCIFLSYGKAMCLKTQKNINVLGYGVRGKVQAVAKPVTQGTREQIGS